MAPLFVGSFRNYFESTLYLEAFLVNVEASVLWQISSLALASEVNPRLDLKRVGFVQRPLMHVSVSDTQLLVFVVH